MIEAEARFSVLVVDDDVLFARAVARRLDANGWDTHVVNDGVEALRELENQDFDAMVLDLNMQHLSGFGVLEALPRLKSPPATVLLSGHLNVPITVQAMRAGVADVLEKPADGRLLEERLRAAVRSRSLKPSSFPPGDAAARLIGQTSAVSTVRDQLRHAARQRDLSVMLVGEPGTGKGFVARILHELGGPDTPFVPVDCGAVPAGLLELKLFGVEHQEEEGHPPVTAQGLLESAGVGTLFLDDVAALPTEVQPRLLAALDSREYTKVGSSLRLPFTARVISTTSRRLIETQKSNLRMDLFYRLSAFTISLPPLRDRKDDIPDLASYFLRSFARRNPEAPRELDERACAVLHGYDWPGNLRELRAVIEQAALLSAAERLGQDEIYVALNHRHAQRQLGSEPPPVGQSARPEAPGHPTKLRDLERTMIVGTYEACEHNLSLTARRLGLPRTTLRDKLKRYGLR